MDKKKLDNTNTSISNLINIHFEQNRKRQGLTFSGATEELQSQEVVVDEYCGDLTPTIDKSRKGGVDSRILNLVSSLNDPNGDFFTTSSCSGRVILFTHENDCTKSLEYDNSNTENVGGSQMVSSVGQTRKKGCKWLYVGHDEVQLNQVIEVWKDSPPGTNVVFKMESCIIHIQCRHLACSKKLIHLATQSGFRNCGMIIGKDNKITAAIRSAICLEVPLRKEKLGERPIISFEYISYLVDIANEKLFENWKRTEHFEIEFNKTFHGSV